MIYAYRKAEQTDKEDIFNLYCLVMRDYISAIWGWDEEWQENDFSSHFDSDDITLVHKEQELAGYSHVENRDGQIFIRMIVVHPHHQRKGIGSKLLETVIAAGKAQSKKIELQVFKSIMRQRNFMKDMASMSRMKRPIVTSWVSCPTLHSRGVVQKRATPQFEG
jgi:ribosomal protein S18 acetylase RimI-like enzyme